MRRFGAPGSIFENMDALNPNEEAYRPDYLPEREVELDEIHSALRPVEMGSTPINLLIYGETGQGKTVAVDLKTSQLQEWADEQGIDITVVTIPCKGINTSYTAMTHLHKALREERLGPGEELQRGHHTKELLLMIMDELKAIGGTVIVVLDEIDSLGEDDYILYELPRADIEGVKLSVIGITNDLTYTENLDAGVRSSLGEDEIVFAPYESDQLQAILARRAAKGLRDTGFSCEECNDPCCPHDAAQTPANLVSEVLTDDAIPLCAAFAAQDTGDAREALKLFFRAARSVDNRGDTLVEEQDIRHARGYLENKAVVTGIQTLTTQKAIALMAVTYEYVRGTGPGRTSELYARYKKYCATAGADPKTARRFRDYLNDLTHSGLLEKQRGRGQGKENRYRLAVELEMVLKHLPPTEDRLGELADNLRKRARLPTVHNDAREVDQ